MITIIAVEQGWLDSFNNRFGTDLKQNEKRGINDVKGNAEFESMGLKRAVDMFNHTVAQGEAITVQNHLI